MRLGLHLEILSRRGFVFAAAIVIYEEDSTLSMG